MRHFALFLAALIALPDISPAAEPPRPGASVNLLAVGDPGFPMPEQKQTAKAMADFAGKSGLRFDAALVLGDTFKRKPANDGGEANFREAFEDMYDAQALPMPFYAILGNHDFEYAMAEAATQYATKHPQSRWKVPARWYRLDLPPEKPLVTVLMLDTNKGALSAAQMKSQFDWINAEMNKPRTAPWLVWCGHHPLFSNGQHGDSKSMQSAWGDLLKKHNVDFYLSGHDHTLQHIQADGYKTTFIVSGGGGENAKRPIGKKPVAFCKAAYGFAHLQFNADKATVRLIEANGKTVYAIQRDRAGAVGKLNP